MPDEINVALDEHAAKLLNEAVELGNRATELYFEWVKQMLSLSFASLTALVALQKSYMPGTDLARYLLWGTFLSLAFSVVAAAIVLRGQGQVARVLSRQLAEESQLPIESRNSSHAGSLPVLARCSQRILPWTLISSVVCLSAFAISNSIPVAPSDASVSNDAAARS
jgi:hypothetical protein